MKLSRIQHTVRLIGLIGLIGLTSARAEEALQRREFLIDGVKREAVLYAPATAKSAPSPVIFGFHGHGGNMNSSAKQYHFHTLWPEAIVIYPTRPDHKSAAKPTETNGRR